MLVRLPWWVLTVWRVLLVGLVPGRRGVVFAAERRGVRELTGGFGGVRCLSVGSWNGSWWVGALR